MMDRLEHRVPPPVLMLLLGLGMVGLSGVLSGPLLLPGWRWGLGVGAFGLAGLFGLPAFRAFGRARTTINPVRIDAASVLVTGGVYRLSRNPMYVSLTLMLVALAAGLGQAWLFVGPVIFAVWINRLQIVPEERVLRAKFGADYAAYAARVRRWF